MKASQTKAAKRPKMNGGLKSLMGTPLQPGVSGTGRSTKAASRPAVDSSISGMKYGESPNDYGKGV